VNGPAVPATPEKTFSLGDLAAWQRDGENAFPVSRAERRHVFSTVTHSSLTDGSPPMLPGGLFVAVKARRDGHDFASNAFENGARTALVERIPDNLTEQVRMGALHTLRPGDPLPSDGRPILVLVSDAVGALQACARWWRGQHATRVIALTGSVGKTTTKDLLTHILEQRGAVLATRGNYNNEYGLPFMLLDLTPEYRYAALEIGISAVGEMESFAAIVRADVGVVTRVAPAHLQFFGDVDTVEREKGRLVEALPAGGTAVLNQDDHRVSLMRERTRAKVVTFGRSASASVRAEHVEPLGFDGVRFELQRGGQSRSVVLPLTGAHFVTCALAAAATALDEGASWDEVVSGLERPLENRRLVPLRLPNGVTILDDTYNASPDAMRAALDVLGSCAGRRIAVLGDMFEMGGAGPPSHREIGAYAPGRADALIAVGELGREIATGARDAGMDDVVWAADPDSAAERLTPRLAAGDFVLVKGSRGMRMDQIVTVLAGEHVSAGHGGH